MGKFSRIKLEENRAVHMTEAYYNEVHDKIEKLKRTREPLAWLFLFLAIDGNNSSMIPRMKNGGQLSRQEVADLRAKIRTLTVPWR